ncbi:hypothetical protein IQ276_037175 [Desmonostoc muscorum LEGE 12446]|nr:hypothetical protein [Desmonostoc muscorum LEGE 12446]
MNKEPLGVALIKYIKQSNDISEREKVLSALSGYWLPFALRADGSYPEWELKQSARNAIYKLKLHIVYLSEAFFLEDFPVGSHTIIPAQPMVQQVVSNVPVSNVAISESLIEPEKPKPVVNIFPEQQDNMVETMFKGAM